MEVLNIFIAIIALLVAVFREEIRGFFNLKPK